MNGDFENHVLGQGKADEIKSQSIADILVDWVWASEVHGIKIPHDLVRDS